MTERPWPVIVLTALGAWLAAVPFFIVAAIVLQGALDEPMLALTLGVVMLAGSMPKPLSFSCMFAPSWFQRCSDFVGMDTPTLMPFAPLPLPDELL